MSIRTVFIDATSLGYDALAARYGADRFNIVLLNDSNAGYLYF